MTAPDRSCCAGSRRSAAPGRWGCSGWSRGRELFVDVEGPAGALQLLLEGPRIAPRFALRSRLLSDFGSTRDAAALAALRGTAVRAPASLGFEPEWQSVLMTRMPGSALLQAVPPQADRSALMHDYAGRLTVLYRLEWQELVRPGDMPVPADRVSLAVLAPLHLAET